MKTKILKFSYLLLLLLIANNAFTQCSTFRGTEANRLANDAATLIVNKNYGGGKNISATVLNCNYNSSTQRYNLTTKIYFKGQTTGNSYSVKGKLYTNSDGTNTKWNEIEKSSSLKSYYTKRNISVGAAALAGAFIIYKIFTSDDDNSSKINNNSSNNSTKKYTNKNNEYDYSNTPLAVTKNFILDLGNQKFHSAYLKTNNPSWGNYDWFKSTKAFGGINKTQINDIYVVSNNNYEACIYVKFYSYDPYNQNGRYTEHIYLKKYSGNWKIVKIKVLDSYKW